MAMWPPSDQPAMTSEIQLHLVDDGGDEIGQGRDGVAVEVLGVGAAAVAGQVQRDQPVRLGHRAVQLTLEGQAGTAGAVQEQDGGAGAVALADVQRLVVNDQSGLV